MAAHHTSVTAPRARTEDLLVEQIGDEAVVFDASSNAAHCLSPLATAVFTAADGRNRLEDLAEVAGTSLGEPVTVEAVDAAVAELQELGLIDAPSGMTRRAMVGRTAMATAALSAAPLVTSVATAATTTSKPSSCPMSKCVVDLEGDNWCACVNTCVPTGPGTSYPNQVSPHPNNPTCAEQFEGPTSSSAGSPYYGSCECEYCPYTQSETDQGSFDPIRVGGVNYTGLAIGLKVCQEVYGTKYYLREPERTDPAVLPGTAPTATTWRDWADGCTSQMVNDPDNNPATTYPKWQYGCKEVTDAEDPPKKRLSGVCWGNPGDSSPDVVCDQ